MSVGSVIRGLNECRLLPLGRLVKHKPLWPVLQRSISGNAFSIDSEVLKLSGLCINMIV
jgi:hypothetical protein